jgi:SAM-dependent methyltransferase
MGWHGDDYQARFDQLACEGVEVHGEADFVCSLAPHSVLDAGCGTGRVALELVRRGIEVVAVDVDRSMLATARSRGPGTEFVEADLAEVELGRSFDVVLMAGNVLLFTTKGSEGSVVAGCARHLGNRGALVAGFQLDRGYRLADYDAACEAAGLVLAERWATWERDPFAPSGSSSRPAPYAVSVHRRAGGEDEPVTKADADGLCELCEAARVTTWYHEDKICWVADCEICAVPMVVWNEHGATPPEAELAHMIRELERVAGQRFEGAEFTVDRVMRQIPAHFHAHARDRGWWHRRSGAPMGR